MFSLLVGCQSPGKRVGRSAAGQRREAGGPDGDAVRERAGGSGVRGGGGRPDQHRPLAHHPAPDIVNRPNSYSRARRNNNTLRGAASHSDSFIHSNSAKRLFHYHRVSCHALELLRARPDQPERRVRRPLGSPGPFIPRLSAPSSPGAQVRARVEVQVG